MSDERAPAAQMRSVSKSFGGVHAVESMDLEIHAGEVLGLLGHNGAGKSTLIKLLSGALGCDSGEILMQGEPVSIHGPRGARELGIETVYQDLALADNLDAVANVFLGRELCTRWGALDERAMERRSLDILHSLNPEFENPRRPAGQLSGGQRQSVAIARAMLFEPRVLIMDEPTASLGPGETRGVVELIGRLKNAGIAIVLVSHDLSDVFELSDRVCIMKRGRRVACALTAGLHRDAVLETIISGENRLSP